MGRPKGSLNKKTKVAIKKYRKRGRPKGSKAKTQIIPVETYDMSNVKTLKFLGYCPKCKGLVTTKELTSKFVYVCSSCNEQGRIKKLLREVITDRPTSKKEYLSNTIHANHIENIPLNEHQLTSKDLKIQE